MKLWEELTKKERSEQIFERLANGEFAVAKHRDFKCENCGRKIKIGSRYFRFMAAGLISVKFCMTCAPIEPQASATAD